MEKYHSAGIEAMKRYLGSAQVLDSLVNEQLEELSELRRLAEKAADSLGVNKDGTHSAVERIVSMELRISATIDRFADRRDEICALIDSLSGLEMRDMLHRHYILGHSWEKVAEDCYVSVRTVHYIHGRALAALINVCGGVAG